MALGAYTFDYVKCFLRDLSHFYLGSDGGDEGSNFAEVWYRRLDPEQICSMLEACHAVKNHPILCCSLPGEGNQSERFFSERKKQTKPELVEPIGQPDWPDKLPVLLDHEVALQQLGAGQHLLGEQEVVVLGGKVTRHLVSGHNVKFEGSQPNQQTLDTGIF